MRESLARRPVRLFVPAGETSTMGPRRIATQSEPSGRRSTVVRIGQFDLDAIAVAPFAVQCHVG